MARMARPPAYPKCRCGRCVREPEHFDSWGHHSHLYGRRTRAVQATLRARGWAPAVEVALAVKGSKAPWKRIPKVGGFAGPSNKCVRSIWAPVWALMVLNVGGVPLVYRKRWVAWLNSHREDAEAIVAQLSIAHGPFWYKQANGLNVDVLPFLPRVWEKFPASMGQIWQRLFPEHMW